MESIFIKSSTTDVWQSPKYALNVSLIFSVRNFYQIEPYNKSHIVALNFLVLLNRQAWCTPSVQTKGVLAIIIMKDIVTWDNA